MYCKLGQALFYYKLGQRCYPLGQLHYYKLRQVLLQIGTVITNQGNRYYKIEQLLQIWAKCITNQGRYYKLEQLLQIGALQHQTIEIIIKICSGLCKTTCKNGMTRRTVMISHKQKPLYCIMKPLKPLCLGINVKMKN